MGGTPPTPEELARWLLASAGGAPDAREDPLIAAVQTYEQLRAHLATFLGLAGFDALWARALHLVRRAGLWDDSGNGSLPASAHRLDVAVWGRDADEARAVLLAILSQFLALLITFIGADLSLRLLQQRWPAVPGASLGVHDAEEPQ